MRYITVFVLLFTITSFGQFDPAGGKPGSKSVHKDDASIVGWATDATLNRGWVQISDTSLGKASVGTESNALGAFDGSVVSLGDSGQIILTFASPIIDNDGYDFAVFENGFVIGDGSYYLELAHVEVSEDGNTYVRFPSESLTDTSYQTNNFSYTNPSEVRNLAGKHQAPYGTLFDLEEVGLTQAKYVKLIDAVGSVNDSFGTRDSKGRIINEPYPSPFASCGFDLDAIAVVDGSLLSVEDITDLMHVNPLVSNTVPFGELVKLKRQWVGSEVHFTDMNGKSATIDELAVSNRLSRGIYLAIITNGERQWVQKIIVY